jgi:uncharacterized protein YeaO (DUF488 family)
MVDPPDVRLRRVYARRDPEEPAGAKAVLVDRVWPRGIKKDQLGDVVWAREVAPSGELRTWFGHRPERWPEFRRRYREELAAPERRPAVQNLVTLARQGPLVLLFGARDEEHNQAVVLRDVLLEKLAGVPGR